MGVLQRFERRIEEMVNRPFARAFKAEVQPVEIASALQRECDDRAAIVARGRTMVPNAFTVALGRPRPRAAQRLRRGARRRAGRDGPRARRGAGLRVPRPGHRRLRAGRRAARPAASRCAARPSPVPRANEPADRPRRRRPPPAAGGARGSRWAATTYALRTPVTRIGRGADTDLRIDDPGISRHHAELRQLGGDVTIVDLGSTNGIVVDGSGSTQARLRDGAQVRLGSTTLVFHAGTGESPSQMSELTLTSSGSASSRCCGCSCSPPSR